MFFIFHPADIRCRYQYFA